MSFAWSFLVYKGAVNKVKCRIAFLESARGIQSLYIVILRLSAVSQEMRPNPRSQSRSWLETPMTLMLNPLVVPTSAVTRLSTLM